MKIFMVFDMLDYYPAGGAADFVAASLMSPERALERARELAPNAINLEVAVFNTSTLKFEGNP